MPDFGMDVGAPAQLEDQGVDGIPLGDLIDLNPSAFAAGPHGAPDSDPFYSNLLGKQIPVDEATKIVRYLDEQVQRDKDARDNFDRIVARGIKETGFDRQDDTRTTPFPGASAVVHPLMAQASVDFAARSMKQMFPARGPIRTTVEGAQTEERIKQAQKVRRFMNWVITTRARGYRMETDKLLTMLPYTGDCIKKLSWDDLEDGFGRPKPEFVLSEKFIVPYGATDLETTPRYCHELDMWREAVAEEMDAGNWMKIKLPMYSSAATKSQQQEKSDRITGSEDPMNVDSSKMCFREVHVDWFFPQIAQENEEARQEAINETNPAEASGEGDVQGDEELAAESIEAAGDPNAAAGPGGEPGVDDEMVDLGEGMEAARGEKADTDLDEVDRDEASAPATDDGEGRVDDVPSATFPSGVKLSYIITYHKDSLTPVAITRNWKKSDPNQKKRVWFSHYVMFPWRGFNGLGLWHLIGGLAKSATGSLRALLDSAVIDNMPGGVRLANTRLSGDNVQYRPMEFARINAPGVDDIRKAVMPYPKNQTSPALLELLKIIVQWGQNFATTATQEIIDLAPQTPAATILQVLEHTGAVYSSIHARLHAAQEREFTLLAELIADHLPENGFKFSDDKGEETITAEDFDGIKISPVSDPDTFSEMQRSMRGQAMVDLAERAQEKGIDVNLRFAYVYHGESLGLPEMDQLFPEGKKAIPRDPVSEIMALTKGMPVDAFPGQNHKAHVAFMHQIAANPVYAKTLEAHMPAFVALGQAHTMFMLRDEIEQSAGQPMPLNKQLPPQLASQLAIQCAVMMKQLTDSVLANGVDPLLGGAGAGSQDPLMLMTQVERDKVMVMREKATLENEQKDKEHDRKLAEKEADIKSEERKTAFKAAADEQRLMASLYVDLVKHFATIEATAELSADKLAADVTKQAVTSLEKLGFTTVNLQAKAQQEQERRSAQSASKGNGGRQAAE